MQEKVPHSKKITFRLCDAERLECMRDGYFDISCIAIHGIDYLRIVAGSGR